MKMKSMFSEVKLKWHSLRVHYNQALLDGCLDCHLKKKLKQKIAYHEMKMIHLINGRAPL
jgi:hypothetical protein